MRFSNKKIESLVGKYREISLLGKINAVLSWDLEVNLPQKAIEGRAAQIAYLTKLAAERWQDGEFRRLLEKAEESSFAKATEDKEKAILRNLKQSAKFYFKVPKEIIVDFAETAAKTTVVWGKARKENKFKDFLPSLKKLIKLNRIIAEHLGYKENPYDALLDLYEPGLTTRKCKQIFARLQPELSAILKSIQKSRNYREKSDLVEGELDYSVSSQEQLCLFVIKRMGYDLDAGRIDDITPSHPFTNELGRFDVRFTNRYDTKDFRESLMTAMHEAGHGLYEQGVDERFSDTPLQGGVSLGIHESQSRFWENQIGRSRQFMVFLTPVLHAFYHEQFSRVASSAYPKQLSEVGADALYGLFNQVRPSLIRTESDEVTYNLHIALRFELEEALVNAKIEAKDLPEIWRVKMKEYLGVVPKTDREGVLQDVHWSHSPMGYFPTYTLGNLYAAQFTEKMKKELNFDELIERGELGTILTWLRTNIHMYGSLYWPDELIKKITGQKLNSKFFLAYVKEKFSKIYHL